MSEAKKCPKCGGEMESGSMKGYGPTWFASNDSKTWAGLSKTSQITAYSCKVCGYIEIYKKV
jgi:predicted nucleic-acid-binding Zn-ribbon protein